MPPSTSVPVNTSVVKTSIVDSARKRENTHEAGPWSKAKSGTGSKGNLFGKSGAQSEIGFDIMEDEEDTFDPIPYIVKTFHLGIQLPGTFVARNNPEKTKWNLPTCIEEPVVPNSIPIYDKFLLYPKPGIEISLEELKAYRWFKARSITAPITERYDHILTNTVESGIRIPPGFVSKNIEQTKFENVEEDPTKDDISGFQVCFKKLYREDKTELCLEELLVLKYKRGLIKILKEEDFEESLDNDMDETLIGNRRQSVYPLNRKSCIARKSILPRKSLMPPSEVLNEINEPEYTPSRVQFEENEIDQQTGAVRKSIFKRKMEEIICLDSSSSGSSDLKNKCVSETPPRSSFGPFNHNDTCSTQQFNFFIKQQSISTPISKKSAPKLIPLEQHSPPPSTLSPEKCIQIAPIPVTPFSPQTLQLKQLSTIMETTEITQFTKSSSSSVEPISSPENDAIKTSVGTLMSCGTVLKKQQENDIFVAPEMTKFTIPGAFSVFEVEPEATNNSPKTERSIMLPEDVYLRTVGAFSVFEDTPRPTIESPNATIVSLKSQSSMLPPQITTIKSSEPFSVFEDQSEAMVVSPEIISALLPPQMVTIKSSEAFSIFEDQSEAITVSSISENAMLPPQTTRTTNKTLEAFSVYQDQPVMNNSTRAEKPIIETTKAFSVFEDQPEAMIVPIQDENSMLLPEMPILEIPEAFCGFVEAGAMCEIPEKDNSMLAFNVPEDITETQASIRELLVKKNSIPMYEDNQESELITIPLTSVPRIDFNIFEDSVKVDVPKLAPISLKSKNDITNSLHMSRKENVLVKTAPIQGPMETFQIFEDKTETVPIIAFRSIKLIEKQVKKRTPSEEFFEIMMKSPDRATNFKNISAANSSIVKPDKLDYDDMDQENEDKIDKNSCSMLQVKTSSVLSGVKSPLAFDVDEENLNTEKFQFNLNCNKNSTLINPPDIYNSPTATVATKAFTDVYDDFNLSIALNENEAALLKNLQPAFKIPEIPIKRVEKKKEFIEEEEYDEMDDLGKSIYVPKSLPETHDNEEELLEADDNDASFVVAPSNQYEHTIIVPEASNKVRELMDADSGNPFNQKTREAMLEQCNFSSYLEEHIKTCTLLKKIPMLKVGSTLCCGDEEFTVQKAIGKGSFGAIFSGKCMRTGRIYAMKQEKPANLWEYYVIVELMSRLVNQNVVPGLMRIDYAVVANNASVLISEFSQYGSLIDVCNKIKTATNKNVDEYVAMLLTTQILTIIDHLHGCRIIHADIKPDNFILLNKLEYGSKVPSVQLIDFGCAIDMDWYQENETFNYVVETESFTCIEMQEKKPWTYQTDLFGLAGTTHVMLFGKYMEVQKRMLSWSIKQRMPRYFNKHLWDQFFHSLLNVPGCDLQPNLQALKTSFEEELEFKERYVHDKIQEFNLALGS